MALETLQGEAGRLDKFLSKARPGMSRQFWKQRIAEGSVTVNGSAAKVPDFALKGGETILVKLEAAEAPSLEVFVIHEDDDILVLNKPAGLIVHPLGESWLKTPEALEAEADSLVGWLWRHRKASRGVERLGLVHRLDQGTSGVMVVAKTVEAHAAIVAQFRDRTVEKRYRALVDGQMTQKIVNVKLSVGRKGNERRIKADPAGREAFTEVHVLKTAKKVSLVEARPKTGRTHQIRVHMAAIGHPVLGDHEWPAAAQAPRLMLHAYKLTFTHPKTEKRVSYEVRTPKDFSACWKALTTAPAGTRAKGPKRR